MSDQNPRPGTAIRASAQDIVSEILAALPENEPFDAREILRRHPELRYCKSAVLELAYEEYCRRIETGQQIAPAEFAAYFPTWRRSLLHLIDVDRFLQNNSRIVAQLSCVDWPEIGQEILGFRLIEELGRGGFSRVYLAVEKCVGNRLVVVKICQNGAREAQTLGTLQHNNIVPIHSVQSDERTKLTAICMPYLSRATLFDVLDIVLSQTPFPRIGRVVWDAVAQINRSDKWLNSTTESVPSLWNRSYVDAILHIGIQLSEALAVTHNQGICHCDIKPSNILVAADGQALLFDFNLAFFTKAANSNVGGTLPYMAPEQLRRIGGVTSQKSPHPDSRSDLFALGVTLYELLCGQLPFGPIPSHLPPEEVIQHLLTMQRLGPRPLQHYNTAIDERLAGVIARCLAFAPDRRYQSAEELAAALRMELSIGRRCLRWVRIRRWPAVIWTVFIVAVLLIPTWNWMSQTSHIAQVYGAGAAAYEASQYSDALNYFSTVLRVNPQNVQARYALGQAYLRLGQYNNALVAFETVGKSSNDGHVDACRAYCLSQLNKDLPFAIAYYNAALERKLTPAANHNNIGYCQLRLGRLRDAKLSFEKAVAYDNRLWVAHWNLTTLDLRMAVKFQRPPELSHIKTVLELAPQSADVCLEAAKVYAALADNHRTTGRPFHVEHAKALEFCELAVQQGLEPQRLDSVIQLFHLLATDSRVIALRRLAAPDAPADPVSRLINPLKERDKLLILSDS